MRLNGIRLSGVHRTILYAAFTVLFLSGAAWSLLNIGGDRQSDADVARPLAPILLDIHGAAAMLALLVLGSLIPQHIKWAWSGRMNRVTGTLMLSTQSLLVMSGYALYYAGNEDMRALAHDLHVAIGLGFPIILLWHILEGRRHAASQRTQRFSVHGQQEGLYAVFDQRANKITHRAGRVR